MRREVVTGYCWPQSVAGGGQVGLHLSSSGGRPVRVEVARVGARRDVVLSAADVAADEHETPDGASSSGCGWPVALTLDVDPTWRSGYYEVVLEIDVGEKVEVVSFAGNFTPTSDGKVNIHIHALVTGGDGIARGGHLITGQVGPIMEIYVTELAPPGTLPLPQDR